MPTSQKSLPSDDTQEMICRVVHEALRAYGIGMGQKPLPTWNRAPKWMKKSTLDSVVSVFEDPDQTPGRQHRQWMEAKLADGWRKGPVKDGVKKTHPLMIPFEELPAEEQRKDTILLALVRSFMD